MDANTNDDRARDADQGADRNDPAKAPLSPASTMTLSPEDYAARVVDERKAHLDRRAEEMKARHDAERETLERRQQTEMDEIDAKRENLDKEAEAIKLYTDMWQRHHEELMHAPPADRSRLLDRHSNESAELALSTGYEVRPPTVGNRVHPGYDVPLYGHPWVRRVRMSNIDNPGYVRT